MTRVNAMLFSMVIVLNSTLTFADSDDEQHRPVSCGLLTMQKVLEEKGFSVTTSELASHMGRETHSPYSLLQLRNFARQYFPGSVVIESNNGLPQHVNPVIARIAPSSKYPGGHFIVIYNRTEHRSSFAWDPLRPSEHVSLNNYKDFLSGEFLLLSDTSVDVSELPGTSRWGVEVTVLVAANALAWIGLFRICMHGDKTCK